jgi:hypothetical protein
LIEGIGFGGAAVGGEAEASTAEVGLIEGVTADGLEAIPLSEGAVAGGLTGVEEEFVDIGPGGWGSKRREGGVVDDGFGAMDGAGVASGCMGEEAVGGSEVGDEVGGTVAGGGRRLGLRLKDGSGTA